MKNLFQILPCQWEKGACEKTEQNFPCGCTRNLSSR